MVEKSQKPMTVREIQDLKVTLSQKEFQLAMLSEWRELRNEQAYNFLYASLVDLVHDMCFRMARPDRGFDEERLFTEIGNPCLQRVLDRNYVFEKAQGASIASYLIVVLRNQIISFYGSQAYARRSVTSSLEQMQEEAGDAPFFTPQDAGKAEIEIMNFDFNSRAGILLRAVAATVLTPVQREVFERTVLSDRAVTPADLAREIGVSRQAVSAALQIARDRIFGVLQSNFDGDDLLIDGRKYLLQYFFPELALVDPDDDNFRRLKDCGIDFGDGSVVDLTAAGSNLFNVGVFQDNAQGYVSGYDLLKQREQKSVVFLFVKKRVDAKAVILPKKMPNICLREKPDNELNAEDVVVACRDMENLAKLINFCKGHVGDDGKWHLMANFKEFSKAWCSINGSSHLFTGDRLLKICGLEINRVGIERFFAMIFGEGKVVYTPGYYSVDKYIDHYGRDVCCEELRDSKNLKAWSDCGVTFENGICSISGTFGLFRNAKFNIYGAEFNGDVILDSFGYEGLVGLKSFCEEIFSDYKVILWRTPEGLSLELPDVEEVYADLAKPENKQVLLSLVEKDESGKLIVGLKREDLEGREFLIGGASINFRTLCEKLRMGTSKEDIFEIYSKVFGAENVVKPLSKKEVENWEELTGELRRSENVAVLERLCMTTASGRLMVKASVRDFDGEESPVFQVFGKQLRLPYLLLKIGRKVRIEEIRAIYKIVFGEERLVFEYEMLDPVEVMEELRKGKNRDILANLVALNGGGKMVVDLEVVRGSDFSGVSFDIFGKSFRIKKLLGLLKFGHGKRDIKRIYQEVFGLEAVA